MIINAGTILPHSFAFLEYRYSNISVFQDEHAFSEEEEEKLQAAFGLGSQELGLVIETLEFFLHQVKLKIMTQL
jgi:hypothetical protein